MKKIAWIYDNFWLSFSKLSTQIQIHYVNIQKNQDSTANFQHRMNNLMHIDKHANLDQGVLSDIWTDDLSYSSSQLVVL